MNVVPSVGVYARTPRGTFGFELRSHRHYAGRKILHGVIELQPMKSKIFKCPVAQRRQGQ
jgi:hypothetical protein